MNSHTIILILASTLVLVSAQLPCTNINPLCTQYLDYPKLVYAPPSPPQDNLTYTFGFIQAAPLCNNCKDTLKRLACAGQSPRCTSSPACNGGAGCFAAPDVISPAYCTVAIASCVPNDPDVPTTIKAQILASLLATFKAMGLDCNALPTTATPIDYRLNISLIDTGCVCSPLPGSSFCASSVTYQVPAFLASSVSQIDAVASAAYQNASASFAPVSCTNCNAKLKDQICQSSYYQCNSSTSDYWIPPCSSVCSDVLTTCRVPQLLDPAVIAFAAATGQTALSGIASQLPNCTAAPYVPVGTCNPGSGPLPQCPCVTPTLTGVCKPYVNYTVAGFIAANAALAEAQVALKVGSFSSLQTLICPACYNGIIAAACYAAFPQCTPTNLIVPVCSAGCQAQLNPCGLTALSGALAPVCGTASVGCWTPPAPTAAPCTYCTKRTDLVNCGPIVTWNTYAANFPGFDLVAFDTFLGGNIPKPVPGCANCTTALQQLYCSTFVLPCSVAGVNNVVAGLLQANLTANATIPLSLILQYLPRPCVSTCQQVSANCTLPGGAAPLTCTGAPLPGLPDMFSTDPNCLVQSWGQLPPQTCTDFFPPPPPHPPPTMPQPPTNNAMGLVVSAFLAVVITLVI